MSGEGRARLMAAQARAEAEVLDACARAEEALTSAREAYEADPTPETLAAYEQAQRNMYGLRSFLRAGAQAAAAAQAAPRPAGRAPRAQAGRFSRAHRKDKGES